MLVSRINDLSIIQRREAMEQYFEILAFSNDIIVYMGELLSLPTEDFLCPSQLLSGTTRFNKAIGRAIWNLSRLCRKYIVAINGEMEKEVTGEQLFAKFAIRAAVEYFPKGYGHQEFLVYCAVLIGSALHLYRKRRVTKVCEEIFEVLAGVMSTVLVGHVLVSSFDCSDKSWEELTKVAEEVNALYDDKDKEDLLVSLN